MLNELAAIENLNISPDSAHEIICAMQKEAKSVHEFIHNKIQPCSQDLDRTDTKRQATFPIYKIIKDNLDSIGLKKYQQIRVIVISLITDDDMQKNELYGTPSQLDDNLMKRVNRIYHGKTKSSSESIPYNVYSTIASLYKSGKIKLDLANLPDLDCHITKVQNGKKPEVLLDSILLKIIDGNLLKNADKSIIHQTLSENSEKMQKIIYDTISSYDQEVDISAMICGAKDIFLPSDIYDYIFDGMIPLINHLYYAEAKYSIKTLFDHFDTFKALKYDEQEFLKYCISLPDDFSRKILNTYKISVSELFENTLNKEWSSIQNEIGHYAQDTLADFEDEYKSLCKIWEDKILNGHEISILSATLLVKWISILYMTPLNPISIQMFNFYISFPSKRDDFIAYINSCAKKLCNN